jgi:predicted secreted acid phosphatase
MKFFILIILIVFAFFIICNKKDHFMNDNPYKRAANIAVNYLENIKIKPKSAVMFDIDDTLLLVDKNNLKPINPIIDLLNYCITRDILIVIITARSDVYKKETINDLNRFGINYSYIYLRKSPEDDDINFKSREKQRLYENYGITILMSLGDQLTDIVGDYSGYCLKLPSKSDPRLFEKKPNNQYLSEVLFKK